MKENPKFKKKIESFKKVTFERRMDTTKIGAKHELYVLSPAQQCSENCFTAFFLDWKKYYGLKMILKKACS